MTALTAACADELRAGSYSFSDEMGGFRLLSATGTGTSEDPIVIEEELFGTDPVVLVIRRHDLDDPGLRPVRGRLTLVKRIVNQSSRVWAGYHVELQEILKEPSTRADGLSFNQAGAEPGDVQSDAFTLNNRRFEPFDRIEFRGGSVDPGGTLSLHLTITDPTPVSPFYLLQDPQLVSAGLPFRGGTFADGRGRGPRWGGSGITARTSSGRHVYQYSRYASADSLTLKNVCPMIPERRP